MHIKTYNLIQRIVKFLSVSSATFFCILFVTSGVASATTQLENNTSTSHDTSQSKNGGSGTFNVDSPSSSQPKYQCGAGSNGVKISIDLGCQGNVCNSNNPSYNPGAKYCSDKNAFTRDAITDMTFAIIKFLTDGVGLVVIASLIVAGIQFTSSRGDPQATAKAMKRIQSNVTALFLFFFAYAFLNYLVPGAILK